MHRTRWRTLTAGFAAAFLSTIDASAQMTIQRTTNSPTVGAAFGDLLTEGSDRFVRDVTVLLDLPLAPKWHVRTEVGRGTYMFAPRDGRPPHAPRDAVSLTRFTVGAIESLESSGWLDVYVGGGGGIYHFAFDPRSGAPATRAGVFAVAGERVPANAPLSIAAEIQGHFTRSPRTSPNNVDVIVTASVGVRLLF